MPILCHPVLRGRSQWPWFGGRLGRREGLFREPVQNDFLEAPRGSPEARISTEDLLTAV